MAANENKKFRDEIEELSSAFLVTSGMCDQAQATSAFVVAGKNGQGMRQFDKVVCGKQREGRPCLVQLK